MGKDIFPNLTNVKQLKQVNELMKDPEPELEPTGKKQEPEPEPQKLMPALFYGYQIIELSDKLIVYSSNIVSIIHSIEPMFFNFYLIKP